MHARLQSTHMIRNFSYSPGYQCTTYIIHSPHTQGASCQPIQPPYIHTYNMTLHQEDKPNHPTPYLPPFANLLFFFLPPSLNLSASLYASSTASPAFRLLALPVFTLTVVSVLPPFLAASRTWRSASAQSVVPAPISYLKCGLAEDRDEKKLSKLRR